MALLEMKEISKSFGQVSVLNHVSFSVESGEVHALLGENGAGKSTLMNVLTGVHKKDTGTVVFDGIEYPEMTINKKGAAMTGINVCLNKTKETLNRILFYRSKLCVIL